MQVDSELAGLLVAVGFLVMGFVSMPIATGFVLGAVALGVVVALLLRFTPKNFRRVVLGAVIILGCGRALLGRTETSTTAYCLVRRPLRLTR
jgi:Na+/phosphate symporter